MKSLLDAIQILASDMDANELKESISILMNKNVKIGDTVAFNQLKKSKAVFGGVGTCKAFLPIGIYIEGWLLPRNGYDVVEIYNGKKYLGNAKLGVRREDVYCNFPFYNEMNSGFNLLCAWNCVGNSENMKLTIIAKSKGKVVFKQVKGVAINSTNNSIDKIKKTLHESNNILVPTLTVRIPMILKIAENMPEYNFVTLVEGMEKNIEQVKSMLEKQYNLSQFTLNRLYMQMVPDLFLRNNIPANSDIELAENEFSSLIDDIVLVNAAKNFSKKYNVTYEYALLFCNVAQIYSFELMESVHPKAVFIWNKYSPWHQMLAHVAEENNIPVIYMENGVLPGTLIFETGGQMGESKPAVDYKEFKKLKVSKKELNEATKIWKRLYENKLNRWTSSDPTVYKDDAKEKVLRQIVQGRPTIFYAGQNDFESGMFPYTTVTKQFHSPYFETSDEAAVYISKLAKHNNWNFIYKRHPMMRGKLSVDMPENVIINDDINIHDVIDISDVTVTTLSQSSYVALIRNKPVVMLGFHQLKGKGCIYEPDSKADIEYKVMQAIESGFTNIQRENFKKHIAQLCKYYLYRDFTNEEINYGKSLASLKEYIKKVIDGNLDCNLHMDHFKEDDVTIETVEEQLPKSAFKMNLTILERFARHKVKKLLIDKEEIGSYIDVNNENAFNETMMYLSQIDKSLLEESNWSQLLLTLFYEEKEKGQECFLKFLRLLDNLDIEISNRLEINNVKEHFIKNMVADIENIPWIFNISDSKLKKSVVKMFSAYLNEKVISGNYTKYITEVFVNTEFTDRQKIYVYELLGKEGLCSTELIKYWNEILLKTDDLDLLYYFGIYEIDTMVFRNPKSIYPEYYIDRRAFLKRAASLLRGKLVLKKNKDCLDRKVAIIVCGLHGKRFASSRLQVGVANELAKRGWKVTIFSTDINYISSEEVFDVNPQTIRRNFSKEIYQQDHWVMVEPGVEIHYCNDDISGQARFQKLLCDVYEYNPTAIIDITNEQAIYNSIFINDYPVITIPLNGYVSSSVSDVYISRNINISKEKESQFGKVESGCQMEANLYLPYDKTNKIYKRNQYRLNEKSFVIATVGNRLDYEITEDIQKKMKDFLNKCSCAIWILVGSISREKFKILENEIGSGKVRIWGYENDIVAFYQMCDVYLDLPRSGGGGSVACAVQNYVPAIIMDVSSDILPFLGKENSVDSFDEGMELLMKLSKNKAERKKLVVKERQNLMSSKWNVGEFVNVVETSIAEAINRHE